MPVSLQDVAASAAAWPQGCFGFSWPQPTPVGAPRDLDPQGPPHVRRHSRDERSRAGRAQRMTDQQQQQQSQGAERHGAADATAAGGGGASLRDVHVISIPAIADAADMTRSATACSDALAEWPQAGRSLTTQQDVSEPPAALRRLTVAMPSMPGMVFKLPRTSSNRH